MCWTQPSKPRGRFFQTKSLIYPGGEQATDRPHELQSRNGAGQNEELWRITFPARGAGKNQGRGFGGHVASPQPAVVSVVELLPGRSPSSTLVPQSLEVDPACASLRHCVTTGLSRRASSPRGERLTIEQHPNVVAATDATGSCLAAQYSAGDQIIQSPRDVDDSVEYGFVVRASIGRIEPMSGIQFPKRFERGVFVVEQFHERVLQFAGVRGGCHQCTNPTIVGRKATACRFGGRVEDSKFA